MSGQVEGSKRTQQTHEANSVAARERLARNYESCLMFYTEKSITKLEYESLLLLVDDLPKYKALKLQIVQKKLDAAAAKTQEKADHDNQRADDHRAAQQRQDQERLAADERKRQSERDAEERDRRQQEELAAAKHAKALAKINSSGGGKSWKLLGGGVVALAGGGLVGTTTLTAYTDGKGPNGPQDDWKQLQLLNSVGWGLVFVGGATAGTAFLSPDGIVIGGRF